MWTYLQTMVYEVLLLSHAWLFVTPWIVLSCPTLRDPVDYSLPGFSVHRILQARVLESVAIPFFRVSSWPRDWTQISCIAGRFFIVWATREANL